MKSNENDPHPEDPSDELEPLPVAAARIAVLKASYRQSWLYFLLAVCMMVAWWFPVQNAVRRMMAVQRPYTGPRDAMEFVALAYEGISDHSSEVSPGQFREQIAALIKAGYVPITLRDVQALLSEGRPMPRRAILMTFDQSRKSSYFEARSVLQRAGWSAVMFLWTRPILENEPASLRWPYVRRMLRGGAWELGAQSHSGFTRVSADPAGNRGNFMTTPRWLQAENRFESPEEFMQRVVADHEKTRDIIRRETGQAPVAFAFPYGDFGQYDERAILTRRFNLDFVSRFYNLGFILGTAGLNTRNSDPRRLHRMLVRPEWTAQELVARLEHVWPKPDGYESKGVLADLNAWLVDWGSFSLRPDHALLAARTNTTGAKIWLNGSDNSRDFQAKIRFRPDRGQLGFFLRASPDGESHVYLGLEDDGRAWLRQKHVGMQPFTLATGRYVPDSYGEVELDLFMRDKLLYASVNGRPVFDEIPKVRGEPRPGMFGLSVWNPEPGAGRVSISEFSLRPSPPTSVGWIPYFTTGPDLAFWLSRNAYKYSHLSPPWLRLATRGASEQVGWNPRLMSMFASVYRMEFTPEIQVEDAGALDSVSPDQLAARAATLAPDGILLDFSRMEGALALPRMTTWLQSLSQALETAGIRMLVRFPAFFEQAATLPAIAGVMPNLRIAAAGDSPLATQSKETSTHAVVRTEKAPLPMEDIDLTLYYELADLKMTGEVWSAEIRSELLRQEGHNAFGAGDFARAIEIWSRWREIEPYNEEPVSLIGDVHLRRGELAQAETFYTRSLEMNPGQINLAIRLARLQDSSGHPEEAQKTLNLYARIFPNHPEIALAQAEWLVRRERRPEAGELIRRVLALYPEDLRALTMLHQLLPTPAELIRNMRALLRLGSQPGMEIHFAAAIRDQSLIILPESWILMEFLERMAKTAPVGPRAAYEQLLPLDQKVSEDFQLGRLSDKWVSSADYEADVRGNLLVGA
ncbi:MAG: polysaccharide deacetylase family protein, partial [Kiritimatiellia bacterium]|nr:polysaccharide deacetylase family protein [Kiritimatiellia bacterium]